MKTADHFWTDPSADELVQRHRIHSSHCRQDSPTKRPALCVSGEGRPLAALRQRSQGLSCLMRAAKLSDERGRKVPLLELLEPEVLGTCAVETAGIMRSLPFENMPYEQKVMAAEVCSVYCKQSTLLGLL